MKKLLDYLCLRNVGLLEMTVALYPIMAGYAYGPVAGNLLFILIAATIAMLTKQINRFPMKWLIWLTLFVIAHEMILMGVLPVTPSYMVNNTISIGIVCCCIFPISHAIRFDKFVGSLNWVALISIIGLVYQFTLVLRGIPVTPIKLPFLPEMDSSARLYMESVRPSSFFWEPAAFVSFMLIPMFISLTQRKYIWTVAIVLAMFLSTSSTGILMSLLMLIVYAFSQKIKLRYRVFIVIVGIGLGYTLTHSEYFEKGVEKIDQTDPEKNARLMNGPLIFHSMDDNDIMYGICAANVNDFFRQKGTRAFVGGDGTIFLPAFWHTLSKYGVFGLFLYLMVYISLLRRDISILPFFVIIIATMFFQSLTIGSSGFAFQLIFLYSYVNRRQCERHNTLDNKPLLT